ncbi:MAG: hypothetical protein R2689_15675 [Microthrixaceae bacterium]
MSIENTDYRMTGRVYISDANRIPQQIRERMENIRMYDDGSIMVKTSMRTQLKEDRQKSFDLSIRSVMDEMDGFEIMNLVDAALDEFSEILISLSPHDGQAGVVVDTSCYDWLRKNQVYLSFDVLRGA